MTKQDWQEAGKAAMASYADEAVDIARRKFEEELDYSEASIEVVERCLEARSRTGGKGFFAFFTRRMSPQDRQFLAQRFGAYVGEVYRRHHGGEWRSDDPKRPGGRFRLLCRDGNMIDPVAQAHRRLSRGAEESIRQYYQQLPK